VVHQSIVELGIDPVFWRDTPADELRSVLPFRCY
jgi:hypothetical protein